jgi:hypothetical protein
MRKTPLVNDEYYHIYNRGVDKRTIFKDRYDLNRFFQSVILFNNVEPIGSIIEHSRSKEGSINKYGGRTAEKEKLVEIVSYCLNPNHFHFILKQKVDGGISEFMKRLSGGYAWYFNNKHDRSGSLFQGRFKSIHINSNEYLLHLSAYVNLNDKVHKFGGPTAELIRSSWSEYILSEQTINKKPIEKICSTSLILDQFKNPKEYESFARSSLKEIIKNKEEEKDIYRLLLE